MSQKSKLLELLESGRPVRTDEIMKIVYGSEHRGLARVSARIYDLKQDGFNIRSWSDEKYPTLTWYQMFEVNFNGVPIKQNDRLQNHADSSPTW